MNPKVSIIVPIYNVEKYLKRCLDSLVSQRLRDIEIIAVNDGSTDNSLLILKEYAKQDERIIVIDKENGGVSSARNKGLEKVRGSYIGFVDPDDWVDEHMYEQLYQMVLVENADISMCSYTREFGKHSKVKNFPLPEKVTYTNEEVQLKMMRRLIGPLNEEIANPELLDAWGTVWSKIYRTEVIKENHIVFTDLNKIGTNEDSLFNIQAFYYANKFVFTNKPYYHYWRVNENSVTTGYKTELIEKWSTLFSEIESFLEENDLNDQYYEALNNRICLNTLGLGLNEISKANQSSILVKIRNLDTILNHRTIKRSFEHFDLQHFSLLWRMFYFCAKTRKALSFFLLLMSIEWLRKVVR
ncbi:glycosyltransferase [Halalkalibacter alkalisediminis]|uniref:Glycosyltransferase n=1 Tax=Halalkalibacter alkalisediminis TaxID=935616 RepID=A0ABV6NHC2_9BACI|nr:glycosyltransferase [Halalkalibacter alkalisediminis]